MVMESSTWGLCVRLDAPPAGHVCQLRKCRPDPRGTRQRRLRLGKGGKTRARGRGGRVSAGGVAPRWWRSGKNRREQEQRAGVPWHRGCSSVGHCRRVIPPKARSVGTGPFLLVVQGAHVGRAGSSSPAGRVLGLDILPETRETARAEGKTPLCGHHSVGCGARHLGASVPSSYCSRPQPFLPGFVFGSQLHPSLAPSCPAAPRPPDIRRPLGCCAPGSVPRVLCSARGLNVTRSSSADECSQLIAVETRSKENSPRTSQS